MGPWAYRVRVSLPELLLVNQSAGSDGALARNLTSYYSRAVVARCKDGMGKKKRIAGIQALYLDCWAGAQGRTPTRPLDGVCFNFIAYRDAARM